MPHTPESKTKKYPGAAAALALPLGESGAPTVWAAAAAGDEGATCADEWAPRRGDRCDMGDTKTLWFSATRRPERGDPSAAAADAVPSPTDAPAAVAAAEAAAAAAAAAARVAGEAKRRTTSLSCGTKTRL